MEVSRQMAMETARKRATKTEERKSIVTEIHKVKNMQENEIEMNPNTIHLFYVPPLPNLHMKLLNSYQSIYPKSNQSLHSY